MKITIFLFIFSMHLYSQNINKEMIIGSWKHVSSKRGYKKMIRIQKDSSLRKPSIIYFKDGKLSRFFPHVLVRGRYRETKDEKWFFKKDSIIYFTHKDTTFVTYKIKELTDSILFLEKIKN